MIPILREMPLKYFNLNHCFAGPEEINIADAFKDNTTLQHLSLDDCKLQNQNFSLVCTAVTTITTLLHINLSGNNIGDQAATVLVAGITNNDLLQHLQLAGCNLSSEGLRLICNAISNKQLLTINLSYNKITREVACDLAIAITNRSCIENLYLKKCSLTHDGIQELVAAMKKIKSLKSLDLGNNDMSMANFDLGYVVSVNEHLEDLNLSYCKLKEDTVANLMMNINPLCLKDFNFSGNYISSSVAKCMKSTIANAANLYKLCLHECNLEQEVLITIAECMESSVVHLDLGSNVISNLAAEHLARAIARNVDLEFLDLSYCEMLEEGFDYVLHAVKGMSNIRFLDLTFNPINTVLASKIEWLVTNQYALQYLSISNCALEQEGFRLIATALKFIKFLSHVDISSNFIADYVVTELAMTHLFSKQSYLNYLNLSHCKWQSKGFSGIILATGNVRNLKCIDLSGVKIDDMVAIYLSGAISINDAFEQLKVANCSLESGGLENILKVLKCNSTLIHLNLSNNHIPANLIVTLEKVISVNKIEHLNLSYCLQGVTSNLLTAIANSGTLQYLDLSYNSISDDEASCVASVITDNRYLSFINLTNNQFSDQSMEIILNAMTKINSLHLVNLSSYDITNELSAVLISVAISNHGLEEIIFHKCVLQLDRLEKLDKINSKLVLTGVHISLNDSTNHAVQYLLKYSAAYHQHLTDQVISHSNIIRASHMHSSVVCEEIEDEIAYAVVHNSKLKDFAITKPEATAINLVQAFKFHQKLPLLLLTSHAYARRKPFLSESEWFETKGCSIKQTFLLNIIRALNKLYRIESGSVYLNSFHKIFISSVNNSRLKYIEMCKSKLSNEGVIELVKALQCIDFTELVHLNLSSSLVNGPAAEELFSVLRYCTKLRHVELCDCNMSGQEILHLGRLVSVSTVAYDCERILNLSDFHKGMKLRTTGHPSFPGVLMLTHIDVSNNPISDSYACYLANFIFHNKSLEYVNLCNCMFESNGIIVILENLKTLKALQYINLSLNLCRHLEALIAKEMASLIRNNKAIEYLYLPHCTFNAKQLKLLFEEMKGKDKHLKLLDFTPNQVSVELCNTLATVLNNNPYLHVFKVHALHLDNYGLHKLSNDLSKFLALHKLCFRQCNISERLVHKLSVMFKNNHNITHLTFSDSSYLPSQLLTSVKYITKLEHFEINNYKIQFDDNDMCQLMEVIRVNRMLQHFILSDCEISEPDAQLGFFEELRTRTSLLTFNIRRLNISKQLQSEIPAVIFSNDRLQILNLAECAITKDAMIKLFHALRYHRSLDFVDISGNNLIETKTSLIYSATDNSKLKHVDLNSNNSIIEDHIAAILSNNKKLQVFNVSELLFTQHGLEKLSDHVSKFQALESVIFYQCNISQKYIQQLSVIFTKNLNITHFSVCDCIGSSELMIPVNCLRFLNYFELNKININDNEISQVKEIFRENLMLHCLIITECEMTELVKVILLKEIKLISSLHSFIMTDISLKEQSENTAVNLESALMEENIVQSSMRHLELFSSNLSGSNIIKLIGVTTLTYLDMSNNPISDIYAGVVSDLIAQNTDLEHINLSNCGFESIGVLKLILALIAFPSLVYVNLTLNSFDHSKVQLANVHRKVSLLSSNKKIQYLCLPQCELQDGCLESFLQGMQCTTFLFEFLMSEN